MSDGTPYVGFGNDTLKQQRIMKIGETIKCPQCGEFHIVRGGKDGRTGKESDMLMFYSCGDKSYLAGVAGKSVMNTLSDCSGEVS